MKANLPLFDLVVIGLGPAGSTAAYFAARQGYKVLGIDRAVFPRQKLCGGAISARIDEVLDVDFSRIIQKRVNTGILHFGRNKPLSFTLEKPFIYLVDRQEFDHFLLRKAEEAGALIRQNETFIHADEKEEFVQVRTDQGLYRCRYLLGCDGASGRIGKLLNPERTGWEGFGMEEEYPGDALSLPRNSVLIRFNEAPQGYGWLFPKERTASAGVVRFARKWPGAKRAYQDFLARYDLKTEGTVGGHPLPLYGGPQALCRARGRIALAGDAAGLVEGFLGEGIYFAVKSGKLSAQSFVQAIKTGADFDKIYLNTLEKEIYPDLDVSRKLAKGVYGFPVLSYWIARLSGGLFRRYLESLTTSPGYRQFPGKTLPVWLQKSLKIVYNLRKKFS